MNWLFLTQSRTLSVFYDIFKRYEETGLSGQTGFYVSDSAYYHEFSIRHPEFNNHSKIIARLNEWDIITKARNVEPDENLLRDQEKRLGDPILWNAIVCDRRLYFGGKATLEQNYQTRFSHKQLLAILQTGILEMELLFDRVKPDVVVSFICVTIGEYLAYLIARERKIPFVNLRPTRIQNYFFAGESILEPSRRLRKTYMEMIERIPVDLEQKARNCIDEVRQTHAMYEGVVPSDGKITEKISFGSRVGIGVRKAVRLMERIRYFSRYRFGKYRNDASYRGFLYPTWFVRVKQPIRRKIQKLRLLKQYADLSDLGSLDYAFFPLHKEPEVTMLVYGRPFLNQIEVVRNIARSLPVGMKLVVKEHPAAVGYRPISYYRKLLTIPNVALVPPETKSRDLVQSAKVVAVIGGSVGLETIILKKPLVVLGKVPFAFFPDTMVRYVTNCELLGNEISSLISDYAHNESALVSFIAAVIHESVPIAFYSELLGRRGVYRALKPQDEGSTKDRSLDRLAQYIFEVASGMARREPVRQEMFK